VNNFFRLGGVLASIILIGVGVAAIVIGASGRSEVRDNIVREKISGTPDMTPDGVKAEVQKARLTGQSLPTCNVADKKIDTGTRAKCFADYIRIHTLEATDGKTYAEMPRFMGKNGKPTNDQEAAAVDPKSGAPASNPQREIWVTSTALSTALNTSYFAQQVALFSVVMGIALLLTGIGFLVLTLGLAKREGRTG
jgi:hypothetical protein